MDGLLLVYGTSVGPLVPIDYGCANWRPNE